MQSINQSFNFLYIPVKLEEKHLEMLRKSIKPAPLVAAFLILSTFLINLVSHPAIIHAVSA